MNSLGEPEHLDDLGFLQRYPELRPPLEAGNFSPSRWLSSDGIYGPSVEVAHYRMPGSRAVVRFHVQPCETHRSPRWHAYGEWCEYGRTAHDACYDFLDGGGSFTTRAAAEWAIHLYIAHRLSEESAKES